MRLSGVWFFTDTADRIAAAVPNLCAESERLKRQKHEIRNNIEGEKKGAKTSAEFKHTL